MIEKLGGDGECDEKEMELLDNETGLYTVRVLQGEKEIIAEFEYK